MIQLTKLKGEPILVNIFQIQNIETIPESKIVFMNKEFILVKESFEEILTKIELYNAKVIGIHENMIEVIDNRY